MTNNTATNTWPAVLAELELQLPKAAYDTWLSTTTLISHDDGAYVIGASSAAAVECLSGSLLPAIKRTLSRIARQPVTVEFQVGSNGSSSSEETGPTDPGPDLYVGIYDFDPLSRGVIYTAAYSWKFWLPLLGHVAFNARQLMRTWYYTSTTYTRMRPVYMTLLAQTLGCSPQTLTGRPGYPGQIYRLQDEGVAKISATGSRKTRQYRVCVLNRLPLLTPQQLDRLPKLIQHEHKAFLHRAEIELEDWQQLGLNLQMHEENS